MKRIERAILLKIILNNSHMRAIVIHKNSIITMFKIRMEHPNNRIA